MSRAKAEVKMKVRSLADLDAIRAKMQPVIDPQEDDIRVVVGMATCGLAAGAQPVFDALRAEVAREGLSNVKVVSTGCVGICQFEPVVEVYSKGVRTTYVRMSAEKVEHVVRQHLRGGNPVAEYTIGAKR